MATTDSEYSTLDLRQMDEQTARNTLTVAEYERWEQLNELRDNAEQTREQWAEADQRVAEITVSADMDQLGTEVEVFGNDLLVHIDSEDPQLRTAAEDLEAFGEAHGDVTDADDLETLDDGDADRLASLLLDMLDAMIVEWDGTEWGDLPAGARQSILADARSSWGLDGLLLAWVDVLTAVREDREDRLDVIDSFRPAQRGGGR